MPDEENTETQEGVTTPAVPVVPPAVSTVVGHGGTVIPTESVSAIKKRERSKLLIEVYGTDDETEVARIKAATADKLKRAEEADADREKERLAKLSENERLKEELRIEREGRATDKTKYENQITQSTTALEVERQEQLIGGFAGKHLAPKFIKVAKVDFGEYVAGLSKGEQKLLDQKAIDKWFKKYADENPEYKPKAAAVVPKVEGEEPKPKAAAAIPPKRVPVGSVPTRSVLKPPAAGTVVKKTVKEMSKQELDKHYASLGRKRPY